MKFSVVVTLDKDNGISKDENIPWISEKIGSYEFEYIKRLTCSSRSAIIIGRKTFERYQNLHSIGTIKIVLTTNRENKNVGNIVYLNSFDEALNFCKARGFNPWVVGGGKIYNIAMNHPMLDKLYLSFIPDRYDCDLFFPCDRIRSMTEITPVYSTPLRHIYQCKNNEEKAYLEIMSKLLECENQKNRTGVDTRKLFAQTLRFNLHDGERNILPLITTRKISYKLILTELLWFMSGKCTDTSYLHANKNYIWDGNTSRDFLDSRGMTEDKGYKEGDTGKIYGFQWRRWNEAEGKAGIDQLANAIKTLKENPDDRRIIVSAWNPEQLNEMVLPPCHWSFQFVTNKVGNELILNCLVNMRSGDMALGVPFNIASYATLTHIVAKIVGMIPGELVLMIADCHIYVNHVQGIREQIERSPFTFPTLRFGEKLESMNNPSLDDFITADLDQYVVENYNCHPVIKYEMAV